ncbi:MULTISPECIES: hypothetical protein [Gracilibacillus]|uniref:hypothetical protein n=1 Tax=Gracilibacillus TaxID=74385 RepID=UPI000825D078|nr:MULTISPECIES: hypothetical protein [Gracilibacillus]
MRFILLILVTFLFMLSYVDQSLAGFIVAAVIITLDTIVKPDGKRTNHLLKYLITIAVVFLVFSFRNQIMAIFNGGIF